MRLYLTFYATLFFSALMAQKPFVVHGTPQFTEGVPLDSFVLFYEDKEYEQLTLAQIQERFPNFRPFLEKRNERTTASDLAVIRTWLAFKIQNTHPTDTAKFIFSIGTHGRSFLYKNEQLVAKTGVTLVNVGKQNIEGLAFSINPNKLDTFWLQVIDYKISVMPISAHLDTNFSILQRFSVEIGNIRLLFLTLSLLIGSLLFMTIYALYHYWLSRDAIFSYYSLYVASALLVTWMGVEARFGMNYITQFFTLNQSKDKDFLVAGINFLVPIFYILFVSKAADIPKNLPRIWFVLKVFIIVLVGQQLLDFYQTYNQSYFYKNTYYLLANITILLSTLMLWYATSRSKSSIKAYLLAGISCFILCIFFPMVLGALKPSMTFNSNLNDRPDIEAIVNLPMFWIFLGLTLEALCFAFALAYRSRLIEIENAQMQTKYALNLEQELAKRTAEVTEQSKILEEQRIKQLEFVFEQRLAETEMTALRAQMNPHFIFNCLNSIKLYTLENDSLMASEYLSKFSKLIRLVLENSQSDKITLENELETLTLYMDMEAMRFKNKVKYTLDVAEDIDTQFVEVPPLLLQPYIENAIWHGLMHRHEGGIINITVNQTDDNFIHVTITDDGIGRKAAAIYKSKSATKQKSLGMKMTTERIELINQKFQNETQVEIIDLVDTEGVALGTKVIIKMPI